MKQGNTSRYRRMKSYSHKKDITDFKYSLKPIEFFLIIQQLNWSCLLGKFLKEYDIKISPIDHSFDDVSEILIKKVYGDKAPSAASLREKVYNNVNRLLKI